MRLALSENRLTKWRQLYDELTPRDLAELEAYQRLEPWGDIRDDARMAIMTAAVIAAVTGQEIDIAALANYMGSDEEKVASPDSVAAMMRNRFKNRSE